MLLSRRAILLGASLAATPIPAWAREFSRGAFTHGVASGDPTTNAIILWTRFQPASGDGRIGWEIGEDENFRRVARRGSALASAVNDYCVKVDARGLQPGRRYYYRFLSGSDPSVTGITKTAPRGPVESFNVAFFSCSNLPFGYFHAYGDAAARDDIDLCLHVGDYIYETQRGSYPFPNEAVEGRVIEPATEIIHLADYNARYASYHADPDLLELRRTKPLSVTWDDHEIANDAWQGGAQNHQEPAEGPWADRLAAATKAYFDWMPIRAPERGGPHLYRALDWGDLARVVLLDTRVIGRAKQLNYVADLQPLMQAANANPQAVADAFRRERLEDPSRSLLGAPQEAWLAQTLSESKGRGQTWQVIAQQIVFSPQLAPANITSLLPASVDASSTWFGQAVRLRELGLPWNLDAWDGYPVARERMKASLVANASNALMLGGDSHNCWVYNAMASDNARIAALEFDGGSVTSPGFERSLTNAQPGDRERALRGADEHMAFGDFTNRGYGAFRLTRTSCDAEWRAVSDIRVRERGPVSVTRFSSTPSATSGPSAWAVA